MLKTVFSILIFIAFVGLVSEKSISYYQFYTSDAYRNTLDFEIPILTTAIDVKSWKSSKRGEKGLSYSFKTHNKSLEAFDFYNEFFIKNGFNVSQYSRSRDWIDAYETNIIDESDEPTLSIFFEDWVNKKLGIVASLKIVQSLATNSEAVIQKVALKVMPFTRKSEKWLETKGKIRDGGNQA